MEKIKVGDKVWIFYEDTIRHKIQRVHGYTYALGMVGNLTKVQVYRSKLIRVMYGKN